MATVTNILTPASVVVGQNVNYTVPTGRVAVINLTNMVTHFYSSSGGTTSFTSTNELPYPCLSESFKFTLRAGDILSSTRVTGSGAVGSSMPQATNVFIAGGTTTSITTLINGNNAFLTKVSSMAAVFATNTSLSAFQPITATGSADVTFVNEEYYA